MKQFLFLLVSLTLLGCMNTKQSKAKKNNPPEKFFEGKDLRMGEAIYSGNTLDIEGLIKNQHYNINGRGNKLQSQYKKTPSRYTYLGYSVLVGEIESASKLLELGADVNSVSIQDNLAIRPNINIACSIKNKRMVELLLKYKVNLNPPLASSPIYDLLIGNVDKSMIDLVIKQGADVNHQSYIGGDTPIMIARRINKFEYVHYFLDKGADPLLLDYVGNSFAYLVQKEIEEGRLSEYGLEEYRKIKKRLIKEFHVKFPLKNELKNGMEKAIKRYEGLSQTDKELLGESEIQRIQNDRDSIAKGVDIFGNPFESGK